MKLLGNIIWLLFGGLLNAMGWLFAGLICCATIIGIPFGIQCFKIAGMVLTPFGKNVRLGRFGAGGALGNVLWIIFLGWELCLAHLFWGVLFSITIIGIPFGQQHFKLAGLSLIPFGAEIS
ncbi:MAG: YccF domain-containing protein [Spirochaetales bacterium]|nr:YccF domain-containing protein [Spirochaetales bacterium]